VSGTLFDTNVWVALTFSSHPHHELARGAFDRASKRAPACFCRATQQSFLRLAVTPALLKLYGAEGFTNLDALDLLNSLNRHPKVGFLEEPAEGETLWHQLAGLPSASPKVWMDAYLAAFAIGHQLELLTLDDDFKRYVKAGLKLRLLVST
jgi:toxin-antitoxin system PIN domain toxin